MLIIFVSDDDLVWVVNVGFVMGEIFYGDWVYSYFVFKVVVYYMMWVFVKELVVQWIIVNVLVLGLFVSKMIVFVMVDEVVCGCVGVQVLLGWVGWLEDIVVVLQFLCGFGGVYIIGVILLVSGGINVEIGLDLFQEVFV